MADGFLGRWSRRKLDAQQGKPLEEPERPPAPTVPPAAAAPASPTAAPAEPAAPEPPPPTLQDAQALTPQSDFTPFVARGVAPEVRNTAMKKLFTDPHFNVMDGLDIYIEDYTQPTPLPARLLQEMASARALGLVQDDPAPATPPRGAAASTGEAAQEPVDVAQSHLCTAVPSPQAPDGALPQDTPAPPASHDPHAHPDLRLQPDHAPRREGVGRGDS